MAETITIGSVGGEYMESVVVLEWAAAVGDAVKAGDLIVTVETAKAATEVEAPCDGFLTAIFADPGAEVPLSAVLGLIGSTVDDIAHVGAPDEAASVAPAMALPQVPATAMQVAATGRIIASPAARRAAQGNGIDLRRVAPSSPTGRIKLRDLPAATAEVITAPVVALPPDEPGPLKVHRSGAATGSPILMLHGFGADAQSWFALERLLGRSHPVIRIDLPNHGQSPKRRMPRFAALAREIADAFDALHLETAHIVGHSLGGACAMALADIRPRNVASLTLLAPGGLGARINGEFVDGLARASRPESLGPWLRLMVGDPALIGDDFVAAAMASRAAPALRAAQMQMGRDLFPDATQGFDLRAALDRLQCPARIIWGRADAVVPWQQALAAPGRVGLHLFSGTGHVPQIERTDDVAAIILANIAASGATT